MHDRDGRFEGGSPVAQLRPSGGHHRRVHHAGRRVIAMDADLQDPPEVALDFRQALARGLLRCVRRPTSATARTDSSLHCEAFTACCCRSDVTSTCRTTRVTSASLTAPSSWSMGAMRERNRFLRGMSRGWASISPASPTSETPDMPGRRSTPLSKMIRFATERHRVVLNRSAAIGAQSLASLVSLLAFLLGLAAIVVKIYIVYAVPGLGVILLAIDIPRRSTTRRSSASWASTSRRSTKR